MKNSWVSPVPGKGGRRAQARPKRHHQVGNARWISEPESSVTSTSPLIKATRIAGAIWHGADMMGPDSRRYRCRLRDQRRRTAEGPTDASGSASLSRLL